VKFPDTQEEYEELCDEIWRHNRLYFQKASPEISDEAFDELVRLLERIESLHPEWISPSSPSRKIGEETLDGVREVAHAVPMLSLDKAFTQEELYSFVQRVEKFSDKKKPAFFGEPKIDGLALSALFEEGRLSLALTRGNGFRGSDITHNFRAIRSIPLRLPKEAPSLLEVRGEVFLTFESFDKINKQREMEGLPLFANPRNAAAGCLKLLDANEFIRRGELAVVFYAIARSNNKAVKWQHEVLPYLQSLGLPTVLDFGPTGPGTTLAYSVEDMLSYQEALLKKRVNLPFGIDGAVFKWDNLDEAESIAPTAKHSRTAIAWKFHAEQAWTVLKSISLQVGRTGVITPVAELEPVELAGSVVSRATLHNEDEIIRKDLRPGDRVLIEKGGDIIPKVVERDASQKERSSVWSMLKRCPSCDTELHRFEDEVAWYCPNSSCPEQVIRRIVHFVGKDGLDIEYVGESLIRQLYTKGYVRTVGDLFSITKEQLLTLEGIKEKSASKIINSIELAKNPTLDRFLMAIGIKYIGSGAARLLAERFSSLEELFQAKKEEFLEMEGIGEKVAEAILQSAHSEAFCSEIAKMALFGVHIHALLKKEKEGCSFQGETVVLTGTLSSMTRSEATKAIESHGGKVVNAVTKNTTLVIVGDEAGSKAEKAQKLHIPILDEKQFLERFF
jgi:DNA ligase (NAD+)